MKTRIKDSDDLSKKTLLVECEDSDKRIDILIKKEVLISGEVRELNIKEIIVFGNYKTEEIIIDKKICLNLEKIKIRGTSINNFDFLKDREFPKLVNLSLRDNRIKTDKNEIIKITKKLRKLKIMDISNSFYYPLDEYCNQVKDYKSEKTLPKIVNCEFCEPYKEEDYLDNIDKISKNFDLISKIKVSEFLFNKTHRVEKNSELEEKSFFFNYLIYFQFIIIIAMFFYILSLIKKIKRKNDKKY